MSTKVYFYDQQGYYVGQQDAFIDPIEKTPKLPASAIFEEPPEAEENKEPKWSGTDWTMVDSRAYLQQQAIEAAELETQEAEEAALDRAKLIVFYRKEVGKDQKILFTGRKVAHWDYEGDVPVYPQYVNHATNQLVQLDGNNSDQVVFDEDPDDYALLNEWDVPLKKIVGGLVTARDSGPVTTDSDAVALFRLRNDRNGRISSAIWYWERHKQEIELGKVPDTDTSLTSAQYTTLLEYIEDLRNLPANTSDPKDPTWPDVPAFMA